MERQCHYLTEDRARLHYRLTHRNGPADTALVMLHGLASNLTRWSELVETLELAPPWDLLRLDLRGHGDSRYRGRIGHEVWGRDLQGLLERCGYGRAVLLGHSLGAQLALHFAHHHPQHSAGLILIDPVLPECLQGQLARVARLRWLLPPLVRLLWVLNGLGLRRRRFESLDLQQLDREMRERLRRESDARVGDIYARPSLDLKRLPTANYLQDLYAVTSPLPALASIRVPTLVLLSKGVSLSNLAATRQRLAELPRVRIQIIDTDHWMLTEKPVEARLAIQAWCNRLPNGPQ